MLQWTMLLACVACLAGVCGFPGISEGVAGLARIVFFLFLVGFTISLFVRRARRRHLASSPLQRRVS